MPHIEYLKEFIGTTICNLEKICKNGVKKELSFVINCSDLENFNDVDIRQSSKFKHIFDQLTNANGPSLYWLEIISDTDTRKVIDSLNSYKISPNAKSTPALKSNINYNSRVLYVGKVKGIFSGRLIQHLGFFKVKATQGLQLFYWAKDIGLNLKVNVLEFDNNMADIMPILEYAYAKKVQPLVGKHK